MAYIADTDITNKLANQFASDFSTYHALADKQMIDLAVLKGVDDTSDFSVDGSGYISSWHIKQHLVAWFCARLFLDKMGINNLDHVQAEKYFVMHKEYQKIADKLEQGITRQMITGDVETISDRVDFTNFIYRS